MHIEAPKFRVSHPERDLQFQQSIEVVLQEILAEATTKGWHTAEAVQGMEEALMKLRLVFGGGQNLEDSLGEIVPQPYYDGPIGTPAV